MVFIGLSLEGTNQSEVHLEPNIIYRIGRKLGLEFYSVDESIELAHATITVIPGGIVRLSAVAGKVLLNGLEIEIKSISISDVIKGLVKLRFGNVNAKWHFHDVDTVHNDAAHDSSGYEDGLKDKSSNTTGDSLIIPESKPPSANTTREEESFSIPETQAISFTRRSTSREKSIVSYGDDFLIPETQDVGLHNHKPAVLCHVPSSKQKVSCGDDFLIPETQDVLTRRNESDMVQQNPNNQDEDDVSELGTQIRICTQDFNQFDEDAIDDFDSSLLLGHASLATFGKGGANQLSDNTEIDHDMNALNWSASNSKCTALNSTKADDASCQKGTFLTPDLSAAEKHDLLFDDVPCTPDIYDILEANSPRSSGSKAPEIINVNVDVHSRSSNSNSVDQPSSASSITPDTSSENPLGNCATNEIPNSKPVGRKDNTQNIDEQAEDFIDTQVFPKKNLFSAPSFKPTFNSRQDINIEDFIETQAFPNRNSFLAPPSIPNTLCDTVNGEDNEDFIETQAFPKRSLFTTLTSGKNSSSNLSKENDMEDLIPTQVFQTKTYCSASTSCRFTKDTDNQDFIETEAFPRRKYFLDSQLKLVSKKTNENEKLFFESNLKEARNSSHDYVAKINTNLNAIKDSRVANELAIHPVKDQIDCEALQIDTSLSIDDELDKELKQLIGFSAMPSSPSDEETCISKNLTKTSCITDKTNENDMSKRKESERQLNRHEGTERLRRKRRSKSPESMPCKMKCTRKTMEPITPSIDTNRINPKVTCAKPVTHQKITGGIKLTKNEEAKDHRRLTVKCPSRSYSLVNQSLETVEANNSSSPDTPPKLVEKVQKCSSLLKDVGNATIEERHTVIQRLRLRNIKKLDLEIIKKVGEKKNAKTYDMNSTTSEDHIKPTKNKGKTKSEATASSKIMESRKAPKRCSKSSEEPSDQMSLLSINRKTNLLRSQQPIQDSIQDINEYLKKIKKSGRKIQIALSMCNYADIQSVLVSLRNVVEVTGNPECCDLLILDKGERTYKFLVTVASNKPILTTRWLHSIKETRSIIVKSNHIFRDDKFKEMFNFDPLFVMEKPNLLKGLHFMIGNTIQPNIKEMKVIIESAGGTVHNKPPPILNNFHLYVVSTVQDKYLFKLLKNYTNLQFIKTEGIMQALVQHKLELLDHHKLKL